MSITDLLNTSKDPLPRDVCWKPVQNDPNWILMASLLYKEFVETHSASATVLIWGDKNFAWLSMQFCFMNMNACTDRRRLQKYRMISWTMRVALTQKCMSRYATLPNCISRNSGQTEVLLSVYSFFLMLFSVHVITMAAMHLQTVGVFLSSMSFSFNLVDRCQQRSFDIWLRIPLVVTRTIHGAFDIFLLLQK